MTILIVFVLFLLIIIVCYSLLVIRRLQKEKACLASDLRKAKNSIDLKNDFIKNLTNDLREPLNPIAGFSDLLEVDNLSHEERKELSQQIKKSSNLLNKLFDDLAELSYYEILESIPLTDSISPNMLCRHMVDSLRVHNKPAVELLFQTSIPDTFVFTTNLASMERLMRHLIINALLYTEKGSVKVECVLEGDMVRFFVTDTGRGIPEDLKDGMFELLNRSGAETKLTGMELSICKTITRHLGGRIWLDNDFKEGTRFVCEFPNSTGVHG